MLHARAIQAAVAMVCYIVAVAFFTFDASASRSARKPKSGSAAPPRQPSPKISTSDAEADRHRPKEIVAEQLKMYIDEGLTLFLIDARGSAYFQETIPGAVPIMEREVDLKKQLLPSDKTTRIVVFCAGMGCQASERLGISLMERGYVNVENLPGGFPEWRAKGFPTTTPSR